MQIIAHRGAWNVPQAPQQPNSLEAFNQALVHHWGIEVDIRDYKGELRVSHNPADENSLPLSVLLDSYQAHKSTACIAFNIKADGLQPLLQQQVEQYHIKHYFTFDMSIPNTIVDNQFGLPFFLRQSEFEQSLQHLGQLYQLCKGLWIDQFEEDERVLAYNLLSISNHLKADKQICFVSPELHPWGKQEQQYLKVWLKLKNLLNDLGNPNIYLCTDYPKQAEEYFNARD
ncbi:hypothetical protein [Candidatus Avelusimicrobium caledoniensis]|uniref:hypothetical protein n=1 Tax=Candidatus Avelusimicrobium caledoniensis TaxID=3416220 RepID=UPI003D0C920A